MTPPFERLQEELAVGRIYEAEEAIRALDQGGESRGAVLGRLVLAIRRHDGEGVRRLAAAPEAQILRREPQLHLLLGNALRLTCGLASAGPEFESLCAKPDVPGDQDIAREACFQASLARLGRDRASHIEIPQVTEIPFVEGQELPIIRASVNSLDPEFFILDTGAPTSLLNRRFCERHGIPILKEHTRIAYDAGRNPLSLSPAWVDRIDAAGAVISNLPVEVAELSTNFKVAGILAPLDVFRGFGVEFEMRRRLVRIHPGGAAAGWAEQARAPVHSTMLMWDEGKCFVSAALNQKARGWFLLDTGSAGNLVTPDFAKTLGQSFASSDHIESLSAGGRVSILPGFEGELSVGESEAMQSEVMIAEPSQDPDAVLPLKVSGVIGLPWMRGRRLFFPPDRQRFLFTPQE